MSLFNEIIATLLLCLSLLLFFSIKYIMNQTVFKITNNIESDDIDVPDLSAIAADLLSTISKYSHDNVSKEEKFAKIQSNISDIKANLPVPGMIGDLPDILFDLRQALLSLEDAYDHLKKLEEIEKKYRITL